MRTEIRPGLLLSTHVDLPLEQIKQNDKSITLLGFILDPNNPLKNNKEILLDLVAPLFSDKGFNLHCTDAMGGRWILIVGDAEQVEIFGDCFGMRTIFHTQGEFPWCASQVGLLQETLELPFDPEAVSYQDACLAAGQHEHWFPNTGTLCKQVKCLLPNHALSLTTGKLRRFWPRDVVSKTTLRSGVKIGGHLLAGLMEAASQRFKAKLLISAGLDSRLVLAGAHKVKTAISGLTYISDGLTPDSADVVIPSDLLSKLGIPHQVVECRSEMSQEFSDIYLSNTIPSHKAYGKIAFGILNSASEPFLQINGSGGEVLRAYGHEYGGRKIDANYLVVNFVKHPFALKEVSQWLDSASAVKSMDVMDLFYIEQRMGRWCSEGYTEWDIVHDCFTPFNCRELIETLKGVNENYQREPESELFLSLIRSLWPELLNTPINPHKKYAAQPHSIKQIIKTAMVMYHLLDFIPTELIDSLKRFID